MKEFVMKRRFGVFLAVTFLAGSAVAEPAPPDAWEAAPYDDDTRETTQNWLPFQGQPQVHTIDSAGDEDWIQAWEGGLPSVTVTNVVGPPEILFRVTVVESSGAVVFNDFAESGKPITWIPSGDGKQIVYIRIRGCDGTTNDCDPLAALDEPLSYQVAFGSASGPNNGLTGSTGLGRIDLQWGSDGIEGRRKQITPIGFDVFRLRLGEEDAVRVNSDPVPIPPRTGACTEPGAQGCVSFTDSTVQAGNWYLYSISVRYSDDSDLPYVTFPNTFYVLRAEPPSLGDVWTID